MADRAGLARGSRAAQRQLPRGRDDEPGLGARLPATWPGGAPSGSAEGECEAPGGRRDRPARAPRLCHLSRLPVSPSFRPRGSQSLCFSRAVPARRWMLSSPFLFILAVLVSLFAPRPRFRFRLRPASPLCLLSCSATFAPSLSLGTHLFSPLACPVPPIFRCPSSYFPGRNVITSPPGPPPLSSLPLPSSRVLLLACPCHTLGRGAGGEDLEKVQSNLGSEHSNPSPARL